MLLLANNYPTFCFSCRTSAFTRAVCHVAVQRFVRQIPLMCKRPLLRVYPAWFGGAIFC